MNWINGKKTYIGTLLLALVGAIGLFDLALHDDPATADLHETAWLTLSQYAMIELTIAGLTGAALRHALPTKCILLLLMFLPAMNGCAQNQEPSPRMNQSNRGPNTPQEQTITIAPVIILPGPAGGSPTTMPATVTSGYASAATGRGHGSAVPGGIVVNIPNWVDASSSASPSVGAMSPTTGNQSADTQGELRPETQVNPSLALAAPGGAASATASGTAAFDHGTAAGAPVTASPTQTPQYLNVRVPAQQAEGLLAKLLGWLTGSTTATASQPAGG